MKGKKPTQAENPCKNPRKNPRKPRDVILAERYRDLQRLRDDVRKAELSCRCANAAPGPNREAYSASTQELPHHGLSTEAKAPH
jgi:hypothetical protein